MILILLDALKVKKFKKLNERYGNAYGDAVKKSH